MTNYKTFTAFAVKSDDTKTINALSNRKIEAVREQGEYIIFYAEGANFARILKNKELRKNIFVTII